MAETGNIGAAIFYILENDANTNAIYGRNIYPSISRVLTTSYPMVVYTLSDIAPTNTKTTPAAKGTSKLDVIQVQIAIFHDNDDYDEMGLYVSYMDYQFRQQRS